MKTNVQRTVTCWQELMTCRTARQAGRAIRKWIAGNTAYDHYPQTNQFQRTNDNGDTEYSDGACWFSERNCCQHCLEDREAAGKPFKWAEEQYSFGIYAGRYCNDCWRLSGFRDACGDYEPCDEQMDEEPFFVR